MLQTTKVHIELYHDPQLCQVRFMSGWRRLVAYARDEILYRNDTLWTGVSETAVYALPLVSDVLCIGLAQTKGKPSMVSQGTREKRLSRGSC